MVHLCMSPVVGRRRGHDAARSPPFHWCRTDRWPRGAATCGVGVVL